MSISAPLGREGVVAWHEPLGRLGIVDDFADLLADEFGGRVIGSAVGRDIAVGAEHEVEAAFLPEALVGLLAFLVADLEGGCLRGVVREARGGVLGFVQDFSVVGLDLLEEGLIHRAVLGRNRVLRSALEDRQMLGFTRDHRNRLDAAGTRADHCDSLAFELNALVRPGAGVVPLALKRVESGNLGNLTGRDAADGSDDVLGGDVVSLVGLNFPEPGVVVEAGRGDASVELNATAQIEAVRDMVEVAEDLGLLWILAAPVPLLQQVVVEGEAVDVALRVAARPWIAIPEPGAADAATALVHLDVHTLVVAQPLEHVHPGEAGSNDDGVVVSGGGFRHVRSSLCPAWHNLTGSTGNGSDSDTASLLVSVRELHDKRTNGSDDLLHTAFAARQHQEREECVHLTLVSLEIDLDAGILEPLDVLFAFVAQWVMLGGEHHGRWQTGEILRVDR